MGMEIILELYQDSLKVVKLVMGFYHANHEVTKGSFDMAELVCGLYYVNPGGD